MAQQPRARLPGRWMELDKRTIEWIARLNEDERNRLIEVSQLSAKQVARLEQFLSLPDDKWDAGFKIVTRSVFIGGAVRRIPKLILGLAALMIALNQIWGWASPYLFRMVGK